MGDWYGIYITGDTRQVMSFVRVEYASWGIFFNSLYGGSITKVKFPAVGS